MDSIWVKDRYILLTIKTRVHNLSTSNEPGNDYDMDNKLNEREKTIYSESNWITKCGDIIKSILEFWDVHDFSSPLRWYGQAEKREEFLLLHILLSINTIANMVHKHLIQIRELLSERLIIDPEADWLTYTKTIKTKGSIKFLNLSYVPLTFFKIDRSNFLFAWTNILELGNVTEYTLRLKFSKEFSQGINKKIVLPITSTKSSIKDNFLKIIEWLVETDTLSENSWIQKDIESFNYLICMPHGETLIIKAIAIAKRRIWTTKKISDYLNCFCINNSIYNNSVYKIFCLQGFDPIVCGSIIFNWLLRSCYQKNTIFFCGPSGCGKSFIATALINQVPLFNIIYGTPSLFDIKSCNRQFIVWWKDANINLSILSQLKSLLSGSKIVYNLPNESCFEVSPSPVIVTSQVDIIEATDMDVMVKSSLKRKMLKFTFTKLISFDINESSSEDLLQFIFWAKDKQINCSIDYEVPKV